MSIHAFINGCKLYDDILNYPGTVQKELKNSIDSYSIEIMNSNAHF